MPLRMSSSSILLILLVVLILVLVKCVKHCKEEDENHELKYVVVDKNMIKAKENRVHDDSAVSKNKHSQTENQQNKTA
jgi:hypothetical protein